MDFADKINESLKRLNVDGELAKLPGLCSKIPPKSRAVLYPGGQYVVFIDCCFYASEGDNKAYSYSWSDETATIQHRTASFTVTPQEEDDLDAIVSKRAQEAITKMKPVGLYEPDDSVPDMVLTRG